MASNAITPIRDSVSKERSGYSPVILRLTPTAGSPQKNLTGPPRVARDIIADIYNNIQHWNDCHIKGAQIVKQIAILKSDDPKNYTPQLEKYTNEFFNVVEELNTYQKRFEQYELQIKALVKLQKNSEPIFISHDACSLASVISSIKDAYIKEFKVKELVLENIAHSKNEHEAMFYAACWTHQTNITSSIDLKLESLLVETGFRLIN